MAAMRLLLRNLRGVGSTSFCSATTSTTTAAPLTFGWSWNSSSSKVQQQLHCRLLATKTNKQVEKPQDSHYPEYKDYPGRESTLRLYAEIVNEAHTKNLEIKALVESREYEVVKYSFIAGIITLSIQFTVLNYLDRREAEAMSEEKRNRCECCGLLGPS